MGNVLSSVGVYEPREPLNYNWNSKKFIIPLVAFIENNNRMNSSDSEIWIEMYNGPPLQLDSGGYLVK